MSTWLSFFINLHHYTGITNFLDFCSTFEAARLSFEEPGRQKSGIYPETKNDRAFDTIVR